MAGANYNIRLIWRKEIWACFRPMWLWGGKNVIDMQVWDTIGMKRTDGSDHSRALRLWCSLPLKLSSFHFTVDSLCLLAVWLCIVLYMYCTRNSVDIFLQIIQTQFSITSCDNAIYWWRLIWWLTDSVCEKEGSFCLNWCVLISGDTQIT